MLNNQTQKAVMLYSINGVGRINICLTPHRPDECGIRPCFRWVQVQGRSPDRPDKHKNTWGLSAFTLKGSPQVINLALQGGLEPPEARECRSWRARHECRLLRIHVRRTRPTATGTRTHPTRSVYRLTRPIEVCPCVSRIFHPS